jgi:hypothetical protein
MGIECKEERVGIALHQCPHVITAARRSRRAAVFAPQRDHFVEIVWQGSPYLHGGSLAWHGQPIFGFSIHRTADLAFVHAIKAV